MPRNGSDSTKFKKNDLILAGIMVLIAGLAWLITAFSVRTGSQVRVTVDGSLYGVYDLREDQEIIISPTGIIHGDQDREKNLQNTAGPLIDDQEELTRNNTDLNSGSWYNVLLIKDGQASMTEADCPDLICVHHKPVSREGETIVCLPHKLVVEVTGKDSGPSDPGRETSTEKYQDFDLISK